MLPHSHSSEASMPKVVKIQGDMDAASMAELKTRFEALGSSPEDVTLDLTEVEFMDSSGVGGIVFLYKRLRMNGHKLRLAGAQGQPLQLLTHLRLSDLIDGGAQ
ncbi:STAS domain-containing protein [Xanthobacteraceae bacterium A53D]